MFDSNGDLSQTSSRKLSRTNHYCIHALIAAYFNLMSKLNGITEFSNHVDEVRSRPASCFASNSPEWEYQWIRRQHEPRSASENKRPSSLIASSHERLDLTSENTTKNRLFLPRSDCSSSWSPCCISAPSQCILVQSQWNSIQPCSQGMFILSRNSGSCIEHLWPRYISLRTRVSSGTRFVAVLFLRSSREIGVITIVVACCNDTRFPT